MVPPVIFLLWIFHPFAQGCHYTNIRYENGTWCCDDIVKFDEGGNETLPPSEPPTTTPGVVTSPIIPVGECQCGRGVNMEEEARQHNKVDRVANTNKERGEYLIRPWMAHIYIKKDSMQTMECTGSLLNKKWVITAAHCFCGTVRACPVEHQGFEKFWPPEGDGDVVKGKPNRKIKVQFGTKATAQEYRKWHKIVKLVIHPDYWQGPNEVAQPHDVALAMIENEVTIQTVFDEKELVTGLVPICLPPFMSVRPEDIGDSASKAKEGPGGDPFISPRFQMLNASARIPFEDMDCFMNNGPAPFPYRKIPDVDQGFLSCHPGGLTDPKALNIAGRTSYITAFGSTSREAGVNGDSALRYLCRTNAYGPTDSIFHDCHSKCTTAPNPSLSDPLCKRFADEVASTRRLEEDFNTDKRVAGLDDITPAKVVLHLADGEEIPCFPFSNSMEAENVRSGYDFPYKHGWCRVCERKGADTTQDCETLDSATLKPNSNWGWCLPECDEDWMQSDWHNIARESMVDSFVYENCSHNVDTFSEFCTGAKFLTTYEMHYQTDGNTFSFIKGSLRTYKPEGYNNSLSSWEELPKNAKGEANENPWTQIRPGSKYQHLQHTQAVGDVCYGDAGGSVWKMWSFRDLLNKRKEDKEVRRPDHGKLAVLTGVISRFEHHCGFFRPDRFEHWSRPVQHSVHARITSYLGWIMETIGESGVCEPWSPTESKPTDEYPEEY